MKNLFNTVCELIADGNYKDVAKLQIKKPEILKKSVSIKKPMQPHFIDGCATDCQLLVCNRPV